MKNMIVFFIIFTMFISCNTKKHNYSDARVKEFKAEFEKYVNEKNDYLKSDEDSPLLESDKPGFEGLHYFEYDPNFRFEGPIIIYSKPDTVIIFGTKGDERPSIKFGHFEFSYEKTQYQLQIFKILSDEPEESVYLFLGFTDKTSNEETYGGGRYINLELNEENHYTIDFNYAYNPYCAYNSRYSCAVPARENHLPIAIKAGEKKYHD